ncbi:MAG: VOC family protein [Calditrichaeota bacterium]|nr:VOC family protein [Calditrichota bacterium]
MSTFLGLRSAFYMVSDINKGKEWYSDVLGIKPYFDEPFYVGFNLGGFELGLQPIEDENAASGGGNAYWGVEDIDSIFKKLIDKGATEIEKPNDVGGGIKVASVKDPWGNVIGIIYNPHFKVE